MVQHWFTIASASRLDDRLGCPKSERRVDGGHCFDVRFGSSASRVLERSRSTHSRNHPLRLLRIAAAACLTLSATLSGAPFESARTIDGAQFNPSGHVTIVHYWATWCAPCRVEMPILDAYYRKHHGQGLDMIAVTIDQGVSTSRLKEVSGKFAFPVARIDDVKMPRRDIPSAIPVNRIYDKSGRLVFQSKADGRTTIDMATLERIVTPLLR